VDDSDPDLWAELRADLIARMKCLSRARPPKQEEPGEVKENSESAKLLEEAVIKDEKLTIQQFIPYTLDPFRNACAIVRQNPDQTRTSQ
jgi:hypothetical protein